MNLLKEMLLIEEPSVFRLYNEMTEIAYYFVAPVFTIALILEYFGDMDFAGVVKKLLLITVFIGAFYQFHTKAVDLSLESATYTLKKVSPRNLFVKKWYYSKVRTTEKKEWNFIQSIAIPNLNDLLSTAFFLLSKVFIWLLKLIYSSVYHLTYVFSGVTAILYFLGWTKDALKGTVQASLWCMAMPFVIVAILALVGNSIDESALHGELLVAKVDTIIWLFGVTLLLLISPLISYGMIKGDGIHSFGSKMGTMVVSSGMKTMAFLPFLTKMKDRFSGKSSMDNRSRDNSKSNQRFLREQGHMSRSEQKQGKDHLHEKTKKTQEMKSKDNHSQTHAKAQKGHGQREASLNVPRATVKAQNSQQVVSTQKVTTPKTHGPAKTTNTVGQKQEKAVQPLHERRSTESTTKNEVRHTRGQGETQVYRTQLSKKQIVPRRREHGIQ